MASLCHPWFTTTISPIGFLFLKLPPPPCAVLLVCLICKSCSKDTIWLFHLAMERSTIFKNGKPSISIRAIEIPWLCLTFPSPFSDHWNMVPRPWHDPMGSDTCPAWKAMVEKSYNSLVNISLNMHGARAVQATRDHPVAIPWPLHRPLLVVWWGEQPLRNKRGNFACLENHDFFDSKNNCWGFWFPFWDQAMTHSFQPLSSPWRSILL